MICRGPCQNDTNTIGSEPIIWSWSAGHYGLTRSTKYETECLLLINHDTILFSSLEVKLRDRICLENVRLAAYMYIHWLVFLTQFQWHEANVLDNWQLAESGSWSQSGGREFDPRRVHDDLSVPLWVYMRFPVPEYQNQTNKYSWYPFHIVLVTAPQQKF